MTIDQRLEALRQSLEQWSQVRMVARKEYEERLRANEAPFRDGEEMLQANEGRMAQLVDAKNRLGGILENHGQRLDDLDRH